MSVQFAHLAKSTMNTIFLLKWYVFADIRVDYINNIMRSNADLNNLTLEKKIHLFDHQMLERNIEFYMQSLGKEKDLFICVIFSSSAHCIRFVCCNLLLSDIISQIGPAYPIVHDHYIHVYVVYVHVTIINKYLPNPCLFKIKMQFPSQPY